MVPATEVREMKAFLVSLVCVSSACAQPIDPRGVFFHEYASPSFGGVEWITMIAQPGVRRYEFNDIRSITPFSGTIAEDGATTWDTGAVSGSGAFDSQDHATFNLRFGSSNFTSEIWRAPGASADFLTRLDSPEAGRAELGGTFAVTVDELDPRTGALLGRRTETMLLGVVGETLRLTESDGDYIQGVFESAEAVGFRVVVPNALRSDYATFPGSETNRGLNLMADLRFTGEDAFTATVLLQTRTSPGNQTQFVERYSAIRVPAPGSVAFVAVGVLGAGRRRRGS